MVRLTISISEDDEELIESKVGDGEEYESKSGFVRHCIEEYEEAERLRVRVNNLERQLTEANRRNEEVSDLAEYVDREKALQVEERERRRAPLVKRIKWLVFGYDERR